MHEEQEMSMSGVPIGTVLAFAGQLDPVTGPQSTFWTNTDCRSRSGQKGSVDPNVPLNRLEAQGWMLCDGRALSKQSFPELYAVLGDLYGTAGNGEQFKIPDYRGLFLRGVDTGSGNDPQAAERKSPNGSNEKNSGIGSLQCDALQEHTHDYQAVDLSGISAQGLSAGKTATNTATTKPNSPALSAPETRPKNIAVNYVIRFR